MDTFDTFKKCFNFTDEQTEVIALARGVSAAVCCAILSTVLVVLVILAILPKTRNRVCGTVVKRLFFGLIAVSVLYQLNFVMQLAYYYYRDEKYCKVNGFFSQYFGTVELLFVLGISMALFFKIGRKVLPSWRLIDEYYVKANRNTFTCHGKKISKLEVTVFALLIALPLCFDWIPFTTKSYGQYATWCWIQQNCTTSVTTAEMWEQIWLWHVPYGIVSFMILVLFVGSLCQLGYGMKNAKVHKLIEVGIVDYLLFLGFLVFLSFLYLLEIIARSSLKQYRFVFWVVPAVFSPLIGALGTLALQIAIYLPISTAIHHKRHQHQKRKSRVYGEDEPNTMNKTDGVELPSVTTWEPSHSSFEDVPFTEMD